MYIPIPSGQNNLRSIIPPWAHEGGTEEMFKRLQNISLRDRLVRDIENGIDGWYDHYTAVGKDWSRMQPVSFSNAAYKQYSDKCIDVIIADMKKPPLEALFQILLDNNGSVPTVYFHLCLSIIPSESGRGRHVTPTNQGSFDWSLEQGRSPGSSLRLADRMVMSRARRTRGDARNTINQFSPGTLPVYTLPHRSKLLISMTRG